MDQWMDQRMDKTSYTVECPQLTSQSQGKGRERLGRGSITVQQNLSKTVKLRRRRKILMGRRNISKEEHEHERKGEKEEEKHK